MDNTKQYASVITYSYFLRDSRVRRYAEALKDFGYQVDIFALDEQISSIFPFTFILFPITRRRFGVVWYFIEYSLFLLFVFFCMSFFSLKKKYRIIHVFNLPDVLVFTAIIPKLLGAKIILDIRDLSSELYQTKYKVSSKEFIVRILNFFEKYSLIFSDRILTASPLFKSLLEKKYLWLRTKIQLAYECADQRIFYPAKDKSRGKKFNLLYTGTIEKRFAIDLIVKSMPLVIKEMPNTKLTIIPKISDEGNYLLLIKKLIDKYRLNMHIKILQPLPLDDIAEKIREANIGLVLVEKDSYTDIIYRIKLYEFIACKVPLIVSKTQFLSKYFIGKQLYYLNKSTSSKLAEAIILLGKNKKLCKKLAENAFSYYLKYNWEEEKNKYFKILKEFDEKR